MTHDAARIVGDGYDRIADRFAEWQQQIEGTMRLEWAHELVAELPQRDARVLELGIGADVETRLWVLARTRP